MRVTPRAKTDAIAGSIEGADGRTVLVVRLAAPPVEGDANKALIAFMASALGVPRSSIRILSGGTSRLKILHISGLGAKALGERLGRLP